MSDVVKFLEMLAQTPHALAADDHAAAVAELDPAVQRALLARDPAALTIAVGGRAQMVCAIMLPDNDEPQREDQPLDPAEAPVEPESVTA